MQAPRLSKDLGCGAAGARMGCRTQRKSVARTPMPRDSAVFITRAITTETTVAKRSPSQPGADRKCLFCGKAGPLTEEHVFGDWLWKLGFHGEGLREMVFEPGSPILQKGGPFSKKLKVACGRCNNGWMSALETAAKPILLRLFGAIATAQVALHEREQGILARWAAKTVAVLSALDGPTRLLAGLDYAQRVPVAHRLTLVNGGPPHNQTRIWIGAASIPRLAQGEQLAAYSIKPSAVTITQGTDSTVCPIYQARFRLFNVVFDVWGHDDTGLVGLTLSAAVAGGLEVALLPVWPAEHPVLYWPPAQSLDHIGGVDGLVDVPVEGIPLLGH